MALAGVSNSSYNPSANEPGKEADLAALSQDIFSITHEGISKTKVWMTMVAGKIVFQGKN
jgi:predicted amidohydrolase YtcJ